MIVKFFSNAKGGGKEGIDYLLNDIRVRDGTAFVLRGNEHTTRAIIDSISRKQKVTMGAIVFEKEAISDELKEQFMTNFEELLFPGIKKDQYNILWVQHLDKGKLELNFVIPKTELHTQKALNPYYHKLDFPRLDKWQRIQNIKYGFTDSHDPRKAQTVNRDKKDIRSQKDYEALNTLLYDLVEQGHIMDRIEMIESLEEQGMTVTRQGKDYMSIKLPDARKARKFKGGIYGQEFQGVGGYETVIKRKREAIREYDNRDAQQELRRLEKSLESYSKQKSTTNQKLYGNRNRNAVPPTQVLSNNPNISVSVRPTARSDTERYNTTHREDRASSRDKNDIQSSGRAVHQDNEGTVNDRTRKTLKSILAERKRITEEDIGRENNLRKQFQEAEQRMLAEIRRDENKLLENIKTSESQLQKELTDNHSKQYRFSTKTQQRLRESFGVEQNIEQKNAGESSDFVKAVDKIRKPIKGRAELRGIRGAIKRFANRMATGFKAFKLAIVNDRKESNTISRNNKIRRI